MSKKLCNLNSYCSAKGPVGPRGPQGLQGERGPIGPAVSVTSSNLALPSNIPIAAGNSGDVDTTLSTFTSVGSNVSIIIGFLALEIPAVLRPCFVELSISDEDGAISTFGGSIVSADEVNPYFLTIPVNFTLQNSWSYPISLNVIYRYDAAVPGGTIEITNSLISQITFSN